MPDQPWLHNWEDYYQILGVDPEANAEGIRKAHTDKVWILHPDRMAGAPESARRQAEEELKKVNNAYDVLKDPQKRREYHKEWLRRGGKGTASGAQFGVPKPKPVVVPDVIRFKDVKSGESQTGSFVIRNDGGRYSEIWFDDPGGRGSWVRVVDYRSLTSSELPIEVRIEAEGKEWGKSYVEYIRVKLDEEETQVRVELQTKPEPVREEVPVGGIPKTRPTPSPQPVSPRRRCPTWAKLVIGIAALGGLIMLAVFIPRMNSNPPQTAFAPSPSPGPTPVVTQAVTPTTSQTPNPTSPAPTPSPIGGSLSAPSSTPVSTPTPTASATPTTDLTKISPENNPLPAFKWGAVAHAVSYEVRTNSGPWTNIGDRLTYVQPTVLSEGAHTFAVRAKDGEGNTGPAASLSFNVRVVANLANTKIAFASVQDNNWEIYVMNSNRTGRTRLTTNTSNDSTPAWSPDGSKIAFASYRDNDWEIYVMNADGTGHQMRLTDNTAAEGGPAWSPDGSKIAFHSTRDGKHAIYVMNAADGSAQTRLPTDAAAYAWDPSWSPDGSRITFTYSLSGIGGVAEIYVMNADGSGQTPLTSMGAISMYPAWSPDGSRISFTSKPSLSSTNYDVYVINADGTAQTRIPSNLASGAYTTWSPDGTKIAFASYRDSDWEIYVMNADGTGQTWLTTNPTADDYSAWSPFLP